MVEIRRWNILYRGVHLHLNTGRNPIHISLIKLKHLKCRYMVLVQNKRYEGNYLCDVAFTFSITPCLTEIVLAWNIYQRIQFGPMSSSHGNLNIYCYFPGYTGATDTQCKGNCIWGGVGNGNVAWVPLGVGMYGGMVVQDRRYRASRSGGGILGRPGGGLHPVCRDGVGSQADVQIVG